MNTVFHITRAFIFLVLASFSSTALSVMINSELGGASLDGIWAFPDCLIEHEPAEPGEFDTQELLIFQGNTVESREVQWASTNGTCNGGETIIGSETFNFTVTGEEETEGWVGGDDFDNLVPTDPPPRQDGNGLLDDTPFATVLAILIPGEETETILFYIDDTGGDDPVKPWLLWRNAGEDDAPTESLNMLAEEPLTKLDLQLSPIPIPATIWLFGTALIGLVGFSKRKKAA